MSGISRLKVTTMHSMSGVKTIFHWVSVPKISRASLRRQMPTQTHWRWLKNILWKYMKITQHDTLYTKIECTLNVLECYKTQENFPHLDCCWGQTANSRASPRAPLLQVAAMSISKKLGPEEAAMSRRNMTKRSPEAYSDHTYLPEVVASTNRLTLKNIQI